MAKRQVKSADAALARTNRPVGDVAAAADGLQNVVSGLGTDRDKRSFSVWARPRVLTRDELENMYRGSYLAKRIVNSVADDMTSSGWHYEFDEESEEAKQAIERAEKKFAIPAKVNEALRWGRLYGGSAIVIGTGDVKDLAKPIDPEKVTPGSLRFLHVMDRWRIAPTGAINKDLGSPWFGLPDSYVLAESSVQVHCSRVIRFDGEKLPYFPWVANAYWHDSVLQHVLDALMNNDTASQGIASMMFEANVDVISGVGIAELLARKDGEAILTKRFQLASLMKSFNKTLILDKDESYEKKSNTFSGLDAVLASFRVEVCGAADIPMTRLFGQSPGGLNATGDGDLQNYYKMIASKQDSDLRPQLEYLYGIVGRSEEFFDEDMNLVFDPLWEMSEKDKAAVENQRAQRDQIYIGESVIPPHVAAMDLKERGTYRNLTDDDIDAVKELNEPMDEEGNVGKVPNPNDPTDPNAPPANPAVPQPKPVPQPQPKEA